MKTGAWPGRGVRGVQSRAMPGIVKAVAAGEPRTAEARRTIADGAAVAGPSALTFGLIERYVDEVVAVGEEQIASAIVFVIERSRLVVEGAGGRLHSSEAYGNGNPDL